MEYSIHNLQKEDKCLLCCIKTATGQLHHFSPDVFVFEKKSL